VPPAGDRSLRRLLMEALPDALGRTWRAHALAWSLLVAGGLLGFVLASRDPLALHALVPSTFGPYAPEQLDRLVASADARAAFLARTPTPAEMNLLFGSSLFVHNTRVGLLAFATGMLAGVPTVLLHLYNGVLLGAFASIFFHDPWPIAFLAWILPHGIPELTAITLCAAAGLLFGGAVAAPGRHGRRHAIRAATNPALLLFASALPLFALAALVESFVRESTLGTTSRLGIATTFALGLVLALLVVRRFSRAVPVDVSWLGELTDPVRDEGRDSGSAASR
jgi:uncharacterized membrane protein SpoIIM required for sporulation